jgi:hypothetical protein
MPTTSEVLYQHLKCFCENDLDGVLADYSSDVVFFIPGRSLKGPNAIKSFFQALLSEFAKPGASLLKVITPTFCGSRKPQTIRTKTLLTHSLCGTGR